MNAATPVPLSESPASNPEKHSRRASWLAWLSLLLSLILAIASAFYLYRNRAADIESNDYWLGNAVTAIMYPMIGALIISRRPRHVIGWLFCLTGILNAVVVFGSEYGAFGLASGHETLPGALLLAWLNHWLWVPGATPVILLILLFPEGRPLSPRWSSAAWAVLVGTVLLSVAVAFIPGPLQIANVDNPYALGGWQDFLGILALIGGACLIAALIGSLTSLILRSRRAEGADRQQLKWFVYAGILSIALFFVGIVADSLTNRTFFSALTNAILFPLLPAAVGVAILRYRLYEIDLLINRTLVYVPLTAILAGIFAASITLSQKLFIAITGASSEAATVMTTLIVVAAFEPLKTGLQHLVDRRFKSPSPRFGAFGEDLRAFVELHDPLQLTHRLLIEAVARFDASGGAIHLTSNGDSRLVHQTRNWNGEAKLSIPLEENGARLGMLALGARRNGREYTALDREALEQLAGLAARALALEDLPNR